MVLFPLVIAVFTILAMDADNQILAALPLGGIWWHGVSVFVLCPSIVFVIAIADFKVSILEFSFQCRPM